MARDLNTLQHVVMVCHGSDCKDHGAKDLAKAVKDCARELGLMRDTLVVKTKCTGACKRAPVLSIQPANIWLTKTNPKEAVEAFRRAAQPFRLVS